MAAHVTRDFQPAAPKRTARYEDVIADKDVDAVIIATPHHWHAPIALRAMQAGKDVYIEKPISHVFDEGPLIIAAAKKYGRVVQQGSQMRNSPVTAKAGKLLDEGIIGEVKVARAWTAETRSRGQAGARRPAAGGRRLRSLARPGPEAPVQPAPLSSDLAHVSRLCQRRDRRRRHSRHRHGHLGTWASTRCPSRSPHAADGCCCTVTPATIPTT